MRTLTQEASASRTVRDDVQPRAVLYRMVMPDHVCPFGLKAKALLERRGFQVEDQHLTTRAQTEAFQQRENVDTTPQVFIDGERIGGYSALRKHFGMSVKSADDTTYQPVIATFATSAAMAVAASYATLGQLATLRTVEWFIAFSMCLLAVFKLRDLESFTNQFLGYDLLAQREVRYAYVYPFVEVIAGVGMIAGVFTPIVAVAALFIGSVGAISVFKAVYIDKRELKCACVGGNSNVPLGFVSMTENLMMAGTAVWMLIKLALAA